MAEVNWGAVKLAEITGVRIGAEDVRVQAATFTVGTEDDITGATSESESDGLWYYFEEPLSEGAFPATFGREGPVSDIASYQDASGWHTA